MKFHEKSTDTCRQMDEHDEQVLFVTRANAPENCFRSVVNGIWVRALLGLMHLGLRTGPLCLQICGAKSGTKPLHYEHENKTDCNFLCNELEI
jgi:hypothetical protein